MTQKLLVLPSTTSYTLVIPLLVVCNLCNEIKVTFDDMREFFTLTKVKNPFNSCNHPLQKKSKLLDTKKAKEKSSAASKNRECIAFSVPIYPMDFTISVVNYQTAAALSHPHSSDVILFPLNSESNEIVSHNACYSFEVYSKANECRVSYLGIAHSLKIACTIA